MESYESIKKIDYLAVVFSFICLCISLSMLHSLFTIEELHPFTSYYINTGIRAILVSRSILSSAVFIVYIWFVVKRRLPYAVFNMLLLSVIAVCLLVWSELWYGSTFYYGEVRDKQGLFFPYFCVICLSYVIWRVRISVKIGGALMKVVFIIISVLLQWLLWELVYEPWNLWQS